ncbi:HAD family hydrolase [bacterium]|nr:MAG: HAD family hydrolase [bacterium]
MLPLVTRLACFDIGGVLVRIARTWQEAAAAAGVSHNLGEEAVSLFTYAPLDAFQTGLTPYDLYLDQLAQDLGCDGEAADQCHTHILVEEYPGIPELLARLKAEGWTTACLSNTNAPHWKELTDPERFPTVAGLDFRIASHELNAIKPSPEIFDAFEARTGFSAARITFFDDLPDNVTAAKAAGWDAHLIDPHGDPATQMRDLLFP